ncbi:GNAT family N-acetyltransferase [Fulvivirgaceae bacterium PWU4]|uniref:GNAT family N-acetyltransferase n=1 Tax=Chryseosolibacter histidini TaxID=2782349 RepID=A0AAP2DT11_9BACT|nr:GNAT family N-acetyltransferase [Chryseosolibacter histidini]MBT1699989.1 GNAT family N-acetyltransferase [Chryseosolibacter histidini]
MEYIVRKVQATDSAQVAKIIRTVMPEFGASGAGFAIHDKEVDDIYKAYTQPRTAYFVCDLNGEIIGGGGIAPLEGGDENTCELKKMYFLPEGRGKGLGQKVLSSCIQGARELGFAFCYLETFNTMKDAMKLYEKNGFEQIPGPLGNTGHFSCDVFYRLKL